MVRGDEKRGKKIIPAASVRDYIKRETFDLLMRGPALFRSLTGRIGERIWVIKI
jgi:hypothetical protein